MLKSRFILSNVAFFIAVLSFGQDSVRTVLVPDFLFRYDLEEVEDPVDGIVLYDQYCPGLAGKVKLRKDYFNHVAEKEHVDYYGNGKVLHQGTYENGSLVKYRNFYPNEQVERELKVKKGKPRELICYYMFGEIRERRVFDDGILMLHEKYHYSGRLKYLMEISELGYLKIEQWNDEEGKPLKYIELKDPDSLTYEIVEMYPSGTLKQKGQYKFDPKAESYDHHGKFESYSETGSTTADVVYKDNEVVEETVAVKSATEVETSDNMSTVPADYIAFDLNNNGEISKGEIDEAVNAFFEDDSAITLAQLSGLVNYFFEQDW